MSGTANLRLTNNKSQNIRLRVSNPRTTIYVHFKMPFNKFKSPRVWAVRPISVLSAKILDFRGLDSSRIFEFKAWSSHVLMAFPGRFESANLSRHDLSREIGRKHRTAGAPGDERRPDTKSKKNKEHKHMKQTTTRT